MWLDAKGVKNWDCERFYQPLFLRTLRGISWLTVTNSNAFNVRFAGFYGNSVISPFRCRIRLRFC